MAHTLDTFQQNNLTAINPATFTKTCGAGSTGLILHLVVVGATARTGGSPTYNGIELEQIDTGRSATETNVEMWFLQSPPTGSNYTISIPNTNTTIIRAFTTSIKAQAGYTSIPDVSFGDTGTTANPSLGLPNIAKDGCFITAICGHGVASLTGVSGNKTRYGGSVWGVDHGAYCSLRMYELQATKGLSTFTFTVGADDWAGIIAAFKEIQIIGNLQTLSPGSNVSPTINIPTGLSFLDYKIQRRNWTDIGSDVISVIVEISFDGGLTWPFVRGFTATGGGFIGGRDGRMIARLGTTFELPDVDNPNRRVNVTKYIINTLTTIDMVEIT